MKALLSNYHQSPRKVRLVADMIRGKGVAEAKAALLFAPQKSSPALIKLLDSAVANALVQGASVEALFVKTIQVNKGAVLRRFMPKARGRAGAIHKTLSIVSIELGARGGMIAKKAKVVEAHAETPKADAPKKTARKTAAKKMAKKLATS